MKEITEQRFGSYKCFLTIKIVVYYHLYRFEYLIRIKAESETNVQVNSKFSWTPCNPYVRVSTHKTKGLKMLHV